MTSQREPRVDGHTCVTVTAKEFDRASGSRTNIVLHTLGKGEAMMLETLPGKIMELKVLVIAADSTAPTKLTLQVGPDGARTSDTGARRGAGRR